MERHYGIWYKNAEAKPPCCGEYIVVLSSDEYTVKPVMDIREYNPSKNEWSKKDSDKNLGYEVKYWTHFPQMPKELDISISEV